MRNLLILFLCGGMLLMTSCEDIIEKKLTNETVTILAPPNGGTLSTTSVTFWWNFIKGATKYNIQVVKPSFDNIQFLVADSMVADNKFVLSLQPGAYQWRIKAKNNSSETDFVTFGFTVDSSLNLSNQAVQLITPINNQISNMLFQTFTWSPVFYANDYRFEILSSAGNTVYVDAALTNTSVSYTFAIDGKYTWRVRAQNNSSVSSYGDAILLIDNTTPSIPTVISPADNGIVNNPFTLSWSQTVDNGAAVFDSLYIFANANQDTLIKALRPTSFAFTDSLAHGDFYWKLRAIDSAGNYSSYTPLYKFIIQ